MRRENLSGLRFGALVALEPAPSVNGETKWLCRCDCGKEAAIWTKPLKRGIQRTCGCFIGTRRASHQRHGMTESPEWKTWRRMLDRCTNPNNADAHLYSARGIKVCERWQTFENFFTDMGPRPKGTSIDRIDSNGDYAPENCRWATPLQQANNLRVNRIISLNGESHTLSEWGRISGLGREVIEKRIDLLNWPIERALTQPKR